MTKSEKNEIERAVKKACAEISEEVRVLRRRLLKKTRSIEKTIDVIARELARQKRR